MASRILCTLALVAFVAVLVEGKLTCKGKKSDYSQFVGKFGKCLVHAAKPGCAARCIIETISNPPTAQKSEAFLANAVPAKGKAYVNTEMKKCESKFPGCKSIKDDPSGKSCEPLKSCVMGFMEKVCEHA